jgi:hypothetical protein
MKWHTNVPQHTALTVQTAVLIETEEGVIAAEEELFQKYSKPVSLIIYQYRRLINKTHCV